MRWLAIIGVVAALFAWMKTIGGSAKKELPQADVELSAIGDIGFSGVEVDLNSLYEKYGLRNGLDPLLLKAIAQVESSENPNAKNPSDPSYGLMQLLCVSDGQGGCKNRLNVNGWPPADKDLLYDPDYSLHIAAQILAWNIDQYGFEKGIAVYNAWSAHTAPREGPFPNQGYVDKVLSKYAALRPVSDASWT